MRGRSLNNNMNIALIDEGTGFPNLALMKISALHKQKGDSVDLLRPIDHALLSFGKLDKAYFSGVFTWNKNIMLDAINHTSCEVEVGGSALNFKTLPKKIEHIMPDYDLYGIDYSMGFTTRGCIRNCPFCIVPTREGRFREHAPLEEFHNPDHSKIMLLDNNFLASKSWRPKLNYINELSLRVNISQGFDIGLLTKEKIRALEKTNSVNSHFTAPAYFFAWDLMDEEKSVMKGIKILKDSFIVSKYILFYVLVGFNTSHKQDLYRINKLIKFGFHPYVMVYNNRRDDKFLLRLKRWVNRKVFKSCTIKEYLKFHNKNDLIEDWMR